MIPDVDGIVFVSRWGRDALLGWLPEAATVPFTVISNFVAPLRVEPTPERLGDLVTVGNFDLVKNHRFLLEVLAEARQAGRSFTLDVFGDGDAAGHPCSKPVLWAWKSRFASEAFGPMYATSCPATGHTCTIIFRITAAGNHRGDGRRPSDRGR